MGQFHFKPERYLELMHSEVQGYDELQEEVAKAAGGPAVMDALELGTGTGETARRILGDHPEARLTGIDESAGMLCAARAALGSAALLLVSKLEDPLPAGPFDLVFSALAVHHLDGPGKADLFRRVARVLRPGGRFVLADVVIPEDAADAVVPLSPGYDLPDTIADQLAWLEDAGFAARVTWKLRDLAVFAAELP
ncbi:MAG TPA: methyltransferase domain-containing protein [Gaiellaceae bacterium]|nr:methyltransferase domain-containing protein [Gaiellaceae bacterium]